MKHNPVGFIVFWGIIVGMAGFLQWFAIDMVGWWGLLAFPLASIVFVIMMLTIDYACEL